MKLPVFVDSRYHDAVIFDVEGVVADTAALHTAAWKATLNDFLARRAAVGAPPAVFTDADYHKYLGPLGSRRCHRVPCRTGYLTTGRSSR